MAILTLDDIIAKLPGQQDNLFKASLTTRGAGNFHSLWGANGFPSTGAVPGSVNGVIPTNSTQGAISFTNPSGANSLYIAKAMIAGASANVVTIYDRLWSNSGLNGTLTTPQTWTPPVLTRSVSGEAVEPWIEVYASTGTTAVTATLSYTNSAGVSGRSGTIVTTTSMVAGQMMPINLVAGDAGVQTCSSVTLSATTGVAGNFGITLLKKVITLPIALVNSGTIYDALSLGLPKIEANSALAMMILSSGAASNFILIDLNFIEG